MSPFDLPWHYIVDGVQFLGALVGLVGATIAIGDRVRAAKSRRRSGGDDTH